MLPSKREKDLGPLSQSRLWKFQALKEIFKGAFLFTLNPDASKATRIKGKRSKVKIFKHIYTQLIKIYIQFPYYAAQTIWDLLMGILDENCIGGGKAACV